MFIDILINPIYEFFRKGPTLFGGYGGLPEEDICTQISHVPSYMWQQNPIECSKLIERKYESFYVGFYIFLYILVIYKLFNYLWFRYFIIKPIIKEFKEVLESNLMFKKEENIIIKHE